MIPTLVAGEALSACLGSLSSQTHPDFEIIVIDNSGKALVRNAGHPGITIIEMPQNVGFGSAVNAGIAASSAPYVATLNDDCLAHPDWLRNLVLTLESHPSAGSCASQVRLLDQCLLDSVGMLISADGSSKQRGHRRPPADFPELEPILLPSASAALYRRAMLDETAGFDGDFFLYCEDTDLGLRAARLGWRSYYCPSAIVEHRYSHSAGRVSPLKAYFVERNRIALVIKNFPPGRLLLSPLAAVIRYLWHLVMIFRGRGAAAEFQREGNGGWRLGWFVIKAHFSALARLPHLLSQRRGIAKTARLSTKEFLALLDRFSISLREVAEL